MAFQGICVLLFTAYLILLSQVFRSESHVAVAENVFRPTNRLRGIGEPVIELSVTQPIAPPGVVDQIGKAAHVFSPAGNHNTSMAGLNQHDTLAYGLKARSTLPVHCIGRDADRHLCAEQGLSCAIQIVAGLIRATEHDLINRLSLKAGPSK